MNYDYDQLREDIQKALEEMEEPKLAASIEFARNLGNLYPYADELEDAEKALYDMVMLSIPDAPAKSTSPEKWSIIIFQRFQLIYLLFTEIS